MAKNYAEMPKVPTVHFERTTTLPLDGKPFSDSTASAPDRNEYMGSASRSLQPFLLLYPIQGCRIEYSGSSESHIAELLEDGTYRAAQKANSNDGSTGPSQKEAEH